MGWAEMTIDEIRQEALRLGVKDRADLVKDLLDSLDDFEDPDGLTAVEIEQLWVEEALRRAAQLESGEAKSIPAEEVLARVRARLA